MWGVFNGSHGAFYNSVKKEVAGDDGLCIQMVLKEKEKELSFSMIFMKNRLVESSTLMLRIGGKIRYI